MNKDIEVEFTRLHMWITSIGAKYGFKEYEIKDLHLGMERCEKSIQEIVKSLSIMQ